jgi:hypothetical protein
LVVGEDANHGISWMVGVEANHGKKNDPASRDRMTNKWRLASAFGYGGQSSHGAFNGAGFKPGIIRVMCKVECVGV